MRSIRAELSRKLAATLLVLAVIGIAAAYVLARRSLAGSFDATVKAGALAVASLTESEHGKVEFDFSEDFLSGFAASRPRNFFEIWSEEGRVLAKAPTLGSADLAGPDPGTPGDPRFRDVDLPGGRPGRSVSFVFTPGSADNSPTVPGMPRARLVFATDRRHLDETLTSLLTTCVILAVLSGAALIVAIRASLHRGLAPLEAFGRRVAGIDARTLGTRLSPDDLPAELRPIAERLNGLLARLENSFERERRFSADLSHELRTPIAELRSLAECAIKWPSMRGGQNDRDFLAIAVQMEKLVSETLKLARGEQDQIRAEITEVDIRAQCLSVWESLAQRCGERRIGARVSVDGAMVRADPTLLKSILKNLLENAVDYAPEGSVVAIEGRASDPYRLRVSNDAPDLSQDDIGRLFDRFWRKEAHRSGESHLGLGLSLSEVFARAMGWTLTAELGDETRIVLTLSAPQTQSPG
ncbi:MAG TPA: ATP-binding protein [Opitutaceae bacterium]|jgi:two-component system sensor histidine kinase QseC